MLKLGADEIFAAWRRRGLHAGGVSDIARTLDKHRQLHIRRRIEPDWRGLQGCSFAKRYRYARRPGLLRCILRQVGQAQRQNLCGGKREGAERTRDPELVAQQAGIVRPLRSPLPRPPSWTVCLLSPSTVKFTRAGGRTRLWPQESATAATWWTAYRLHTR